MSHGRGTHEDTLLAVLFSEIDGTFPELFIERSVLSLLWTNAEHAHSVSSLFYFISRNRLPRIWLIFGVRMTECWPSWTSMTTRAAWRQPGAVWDHDEELFLWIPVSVRSVSWESQWKFISLTLTSSWSWTIKGPWRKAELCTVLSWTLNETFGSVSFLLPGCFHLLKMTRLCSDGVISLAVKSKIWSAFYSAHYQSVVLNVLIFLYLWSQSFFTPCSLPAIICILVISPLWLWWLSPSLIKQENRLSNEGKSH